MQMSHEETKKEIQRLKLLEASQELEQLTKRVRALGGDPEHRQEERRLSSPGAPQRFLLRPRLQRRGYCLCSSYELQAGKAKAEKPLPR